MTASPEVYAPFPLQLPFRTNETAALYEDKFNVEVGPHTVCLNAIGTLRSSWMTKIHRLTAKMPAFGELYGVSSLEGLSTSIIVPNPQAVSGFREKELVQAGAFNWQFLLASGDPEQLGNTPTLEYVSYLPPGFSPISNDPITYLHDLLDHAPEIKRLPYQSVNIFRFLCQDALAMVMEDPQVAGVYQAWLVDAFDVLTDPGLNGFVDDDAKGKLVTWFMRKVIAYTSDGLPGFQLIQQRTQKVINNHPVLDATGKAVNILEWEAGPELAAHYERVDAILNLPPRISAAQLHRESMALAA